MQPPKLAQKLFVWFSGNANIHDLQGDMDELFVLHCKSKGVAKARMIYWRNVLSLCFSYALRKRKHDASHGHFSTTTFSLDMLKSYVKVASRNLYQHKYFTILNAFGLAIGMSISLLLIAMFSYVRTYDRFHEDGDHLYTIITHRSAGVDERHMAAAPAALVEKINTEYSGQVKAIQVRSGFYAEANIRDERVPLQGYFCDDQFLSMFTFPLAHGSKHDLLTRPNQLVLTEKSALKLFGKTDVVGQTIEFYDLGLFEVRGVLQDIPNNSHLMFEVLVSLATWQPSTESIEHQWTDYQNQYVYVNLENDQPQQLKDYLNRFASTMYSNTPIKVSFDVQHLYNIVTSDVYHAIGPKWELSGFVVFGSISLLILLPACFNYTNIAIARALKRSKEIGLRKTLGGMQRQIFFQFITETMIICLIALTGAIGFFIFIRGEFQSMMVAGSVLDLSITPFVATLFISFALITGFMAGVFPALYFSRLNPVEAIKSKISTGKFRGMSIRKGLTIFQFAMSFCFILSIIVFGRQYRSLVTMDFGFSKENIVIIDLQTVNPELLKSELVKIPAVQSVSFSSGMPALSNERVWIYLEDDSMETNQLFIDPAFLKQLNLELIYGASLPETFSGIEQGILVNEQFVVNAGLSIEDAVGQIITIDSIDLPIAGVIRDFRHAPASHPVSNFILRYNPSRFSQVNAVIDMANVIQTYSALEKSWEILNPDQPLQAAFFEDKLNDSFDTYKVLIKLAGFLGLLAITISILGLLGMVVFTVETRLKEVSIRKVLGASPATIILLLSKDYLRLLSFAVLLGIPLAIFIYESVFTQIPNYHADLTLWDILAGALGLFLLGITTITSQTYKTALTKPAEVLKAE